MTGLNAMFARTLCMLTTVLLSIHSVSGEERIRSVLEQPNIHIEAAVRMLALVTAATGDKKKAACIDNMYFGSPSVTRMAVNKFWQYPKDRPEVIILLSYDKWCAGGFDIGRDETGSLWKHTNTQAIPLSLEESADIAIFAGVRMLIAFAASVKQKDAGSCIGKQYSSGAIQERVSRVLGVNPKAAISATVYDAARELCGFPASGAPSGAVTLPPIPDLHGAARERLLAVKDLKFCEGRAEPERKKCVKEKSAARDQGVFDATLETLDQKRATAQRELEDIQRRAWRLPDGQRIYPDENGIWRNENGEIVPPEVAATRVPPPK